MIVNAPKPDDYKRPVGRPRMDEAERILEHELAPKHKILRSHIPPVPDDLFEQLGLFVEVQRNEEVYARLSKKGLTFIPSTKDDTIIALLACERMRLMLLKELALFGVTEDDADAMVHNTFETVDS